MQESRSAAITAADLDSCNGHFGPTPEFPAGIYHYHLLDEVSANPIPCLSGVVADIDTPVPATPEISSEGVEDEPSKDERDDADEGGAEIADEVEFDGRSFSVE